MGGPTRVGIIGVDDEVVELELRPEQYVTGSQHCLELLGRDLFGCLRRRPWRLVFGGLGRVVRGSVCRKRGGWRTSRIMVAAIEPAGGVGGELVRPPRGARRCTLEQQPGVLLGMPAGLRQHGRCVCVCVWGG